MTSKLSKNIVERGLWTLAQAALGFIAVELADVPVAYAPVVAAGLSFAKNLVAERLAASK
jgi:hypothetical protein